MVSPSRENVSGCSTEDCSKVKNTIKRPDDKLSNHLSQNTTLRCRLFQIENSFSIKADEAYYDVVCSVVGLVPTYRARPRSSISLNKRAAGISIPKPFRN
jgi:hypothetical protein